VSHHRETVTALNAPAAVGPYAQGIRAGGLLFCSGQIPLDPETGEMVEDGPAAQVRRCLENVGAVCAAAGTSLADAVRVTLYLTDLGAWDEVNAAYAEHFPADPPARVTVEVAGLPRGAHVQVDAVVALTG
jgi:2-iminobutanoate/2-iminopropanoate deaminase